MKSMVVFLAVACLFLAYRLHNLEKELLQAQRNAAIAVLSAEAENNKIGAIAPFFSQDKEAFARAWLDTTNMPGAVFPEEILLPLKQELERRRATPEARKLAEEIFR